MLQDVVPAPEHSESQGIVVLSGREPAAEGRQCRVFVHPDDPALLIKIPRHPAEFGEPWYKRLRGRYTAARRELAEYQSLAAHKPSDLNLIERAIGFIETDLGPGLVVEALRARSGDLASNLQRIAKHNRFDPALRQKLEAFLIRIIASPLVAHDLRARNIVLAYDAKKKNDRFVLVDGIGRRPDVPLGGLSRRLDQMNKKRRAKKLMAEVETLIPRAST